jgi:hypothetical protein
MAGCPGYEYNGKNTKVTKGGKKRAKKAPCNRIEIYSLDDAGYIIALREGNEG